MERAISLVLLFRSGSMVGLQPPAGCLWHPLGRSRSSYGMEAMGSVHGDPPTAAALWEPPTPTIAHVRSVIDLTNDPSYPTLHDSPFLFYLVESLSGMFWSSSHIPGEEVSHPFRHPTRRRNDPLARAALYQLSYIPCACLATHPSRTQHTTPHRTMLSKCPLVTSLC
ncbi:hypothetical protein KP509_01G057400 [Ceratopteris richardii]|uniref:Secreted protein n=1 Tax=Ceratopteris richardii TaxID=49495 RepID=A0A8T2VPT4_CERRI|nr:hypothetical protein KP509_01G057400 [Ceratopteris richardii]